MFQHLMTIFQTKAIFQKVDKPMKLRYSEAESLGQFMS